MGLIRRIAEKNSLFWVSLQGMLKKEIIYLLRFPQVFVTSFFFPFMEILLLGFIVANNVQQIDTVIYDLSHTQESRKLIEQFSNTNDFYIVKVVNSEDEIYDALIKGKAKVGIKIPYDYSRKVLKNETASVLVLVDGSNAAITTEATNTADIIALENSIKKITTTNPHPVPIEVRASVLFNPEGKAVNYLLPGALIFELTLVTMMFIALSIVNEREQGNFEQLFITPVNSIGLIAGKMLPYGVLAFVQQFILFMELQIIFKVPIHGSFPLLMVLFIPYILLTLGLGVIISVIVKTQMEVIQLSALARIIPAIYLSGYIFPIEGMPTNFQKFVRFIPESHLMDIIRGIVLRGAGLKELMLPVLVLSLMSIIIVSLAIFMYEKLLVSRP